MWTVGIWVLNWRPPDRVEGFVLSSIYLSSSCRPGVVYEGMAVSIMDKPTIIYLGDATHPLALFLVGARIGALRSGSRDQWQAIAVLASIRLA